MAQERTHVGSACRLGAVIGMARELRAATDPFEDYLANSLENFEVR